MADMKPSSVDAIVTDPPYGLKFMGKDWDHGVPGIPFWNEALRVAKPGAHLLAFGGTRTSHRLVCAIEDAGWEIRDSIIWLYGQGFPKGKTALKPAHEPIVVARKPGRSSGVRVEVCRVGTESTLSYCKGGRRGAAFNCAHDGSFRSAGPHGSSLGRWPANVIHSGDDCVLAVFPESKSGVSVTRNGGGRLIGGNGIYGGSKPHNGCPDSGYTDSGSAARFFYCAKARQSERGEGNIHPCVKPLALMRYLCRLVTPPGGLVLDPFMGSGSTGKAAKLEHFHFIGFDLDASYVAIARRRIKSA